VLPPHVQRESDSFQRELSCWCKIVIAEWHVRIAILGLLVLAVVNFLAFAVIGVVGIVHGVSEPFPTWFKNGSDLCFYLGLLLTFISLPFLASSQQRKRAGLSAGVAFGTVMIIAFLTARG
jgi:hypothetical protein